MSTSWKCRKNFLTPINYFTEKLNLKGKTPCTCKSGDNDLIIFPNLDFRQTHRLGLHIQALSVVIKRNEFEVSNIRKHGKSC
jgi:hypothetical protein